MTKLHTLALPTHSSSKDERKSVPSACDPESGGILSSAAKDTKEYEQSQHISRDLQLRTEKGRKRNKFWDDCTETLFCTCYVDFLNTHKDALTLPKKELFEIIAQKMYEKSGKIFTHRQLCDKFKRFKCRHKVYTSLQIKRTKNWWKQREREDGCFKKIKNGEPPPNFELLRIIFEGVECIEQDKSKSDSFGELMHGYDLPLENLMREGEVEAYKSTTVEEESQTEKRTEMDGKEILLMKDKEIEVMKIKHEQQIEEIETNAKRKEEHLSTKVKELEDHVKDMRKSSQLISKDMCALQLKWRDEVSNLGSNLKYLVDAAENYAKVFAENKKLHNENKILYNELQELKGNIRVYCRVRPWLPGQNKEATIVAHTSEDGEIWVSNPSKQVKNEYQTFKFNKVFGSSASQGQVFLEIQPLIRSVLDGFSVCIFAYGQTGSGKTYTMSGPSSGKQDWGVNYRALNELFDISHNRRNSFSYKVQVQMVEIYNEGIHNLLSNDIGQTRLQIQSTSDGLVIPEATLHLVESTSDVLKLMEMGNQNRAVGSTALNESSSRSHSILIVHISGSNLKDGLKFKSYLHLIDLAGSERVERTGATGDRLTEAQYINKSLSALSDVIVALSRKSSHVPYRNSKLTHILQNSLGGHAKTLMLIHVSPEVESYSETLSTLKFAERVSGVELGAARRNTEENGLSKKVSFEDDGISAGDNASHRITDMTTDHMHKGSSRITLKNRSKLKDPILKTPGPSKGVPNKYLTGGSSVRGSKRLP